MARSTTQTIVLQAVVDRLISKVSQFTEENCFLTTTPPEDPPENITTNVFCTVSPTNSQFDQGVHEGAGVDCTIEEAGVQIVIFNSEKLDRHGRDTVMLTEDARGLLVMKREILRYLSGHDLEDQNNNQILVSRMAPLRSDNPKSARDNKTRVGDLSILFSTDFQWDLD